MRITHNMLTRNYLGNMNNNLKNLSKSNEKLSSQRSFSKAWENVSGANRALRFRAMLADNERYEANIADVKGQFTAVEDNIRSVNDMINTATDKLLQAANGAISDSDRVQIATEIEGLQNQLFQISNTQYNGKFIFGSSGNAAGTAPFTMNNGRLEYNGTDVDSMIVGPGNKPLKPDGSGNPIDFNKDSYVDIGLGFKTDAAGVLDPETALRTTFSGVDVFGFGTTNGMPNNLFSLLGKISDDMKTGNLAGLSDNVTHLKEQQNSLLTTITDIGTLTSYMEQASTRIKSDTLNLQETQNGIEAVSLSEEMMYNKDFEMAWMVTLQLGSKILPPSIFDYMR